MIGEFAASAADAAIGKSVGRLAVALSQVVVDRRRRDHAVRRGDADLIERRNNVPCGVKAAQTEPLMRVGDDSALGIGAQVQLVHERDVGPRAECRIERIDLRRRAAGKMQGHRLFLESVARDRARVPGDAGLGEVGTVFFVKFAGLAGEQRGCARDGPQEQGFGDAADFAPMTPIRACASGWPASKPSQIGQ